MIRETLSLGEARRIALAAQGFDRPRPAGRVRADHLRRTIRQLGLIQIDYVNVLVPAHYLIPFSRLGPYERPLLDGIIYSRQGGRRRELQEFPEFTEFTEQWAHEASILPVETWPLLRHRMESHRPRPWGFERFLKDHPEYARWVLEEVRRRGPLAADELKESEGVSGFEGAQFGRIPGAWHRSVQRAVLEAHFGQGVLAAAHRAPNFARSYDLAERIIPPEHHGRKVEREDAERELLRRAARAQGIAAASDLADYYRMSIRDARRRIIELASAGELREVAVDGWREPGYLHPQARLPGRIEVGEAGALLSPFDPLVWYRPRLARLFNFDYRIEIFVPEPKRRWGYYVLPFLLGDRLVARVDLKADRAGRRLLVLAAYLEPINGSAAGRDPAETDYSPGAVARALARELRTLANWLGLDSIAVSRKGDLARSLSDAFRATKLPKQRR